MPIALTCDCGRAMRVKDELASRKIRCPACSAVITVRKPEAPKDAEEEAINLLLEESPDESQGIRQRTFDGAPAPRTDALQPRPAPPPPEWKWRKKKSAARPISVRRPKAKSGGGLFNNVNPNYGVMWTGILVALGGVALGLVNVAIFFAGWVVFKLVIVAILLFFAGVGTFFKGLTGRTD